MLKLYGVPLSQPFRSVAWTLLQLQCPFQIQLAVPGMDSTIGSRHEDYKAKSIHGTTQVPLLQDGDDFYISESPAIMMYLCQKFNNQSLLGGTSLQNQAKIQSYMHWHHTATRKLAYLVRPVLRLDISDKPLSEKNIKDCQQVLITINNGWLGTITTTNTTTTGTTAAKAAAASSSMFIAGAPQPTIADILAFEEILDVYLSNEVFKNQSSISLKEYPNIIVWMDQMKKLPFYEQAHASIASMAETQSSSFPMQKRLSIATKLGLKALHDAQQEYMPASKL